MLRLVSWNVSHLQPLDELQRAGYDVALLQELRLPPEEWHDRVIPRPDGLWSTAGRRRTFRTAVVQLSEQVTLDATPLRLLDVVDDDAQNIGVSLHGSLSAATVKRNHEALFTAVSWYAPWESAHRRPFSRDHDYADANAHRLVSDISALISDRDGHRIIAAGDLNILRGHGEDGDTYWRDRYQTVFDRLEALGLVCVGPDARPGVRRAAPHAELPPDTKNVPTFHTGGPENARRQLDFVFASVSIANKVDVTALNAIEDWGPSDHCRIQVDVDL